MKKIIVKSLSVILVVILTLTSAPLSGFVGLKLPKWLDSSVKAAAATMQSIQIGDCITLGTYYGEPIVWRCVDIDENGPLMLSEKILCLKAFDANGEDSTYHNDGWGYIRKKYGSNCWQDSSLRQWLNSDETQISWTHCPPTSTAVSYNSYDNEAGFLSNFTQFERTLIKEVTQKVSVNIYETERPGYCDGGFSDIGYKYLKNSSYDISQYYYKNITDRFFLLTGSQFNRIYKSNPNYLLAAPTEQAVNSSDYVADSLNSNNNFSYWINVPWGNNYACYENHMYVNSSGNVGNAWAMWGEYGVRPAFYLNADDYNVADTESQLMINSLPTFSHEEAIDFLSFLYNRKDEFEGICITNDIQYKLLTGNLPSNMSVDEVKGLISAFLIVVQTVLNENIKNSEVKTDFLADAMIKRLEKEVGGMSNLDEEIINQEMGKIGQLVEDGLLDIMVDTVWRTTGIRVLGKYIDDINAVISGINSTKNVVSNVESIVNYALAAVDLYGVTLGQESLARYNYFIGYINNRGVLDDTTFDALMDCNYDALRMSYPLTEIIDFLSPIIGKSSWAEHRATLDKWGEYIYQLSEYQSKDFHRYKETKYPSTCISDGFSEFKCIYCDKEFTGNIIKAPGHKYKKTIITPTCEKQGYDLYQCEVCVYNYKDNYTEATGHSICKQEAIVPTCTTDGYTVNYCKCGHEWQTDTTTALQHKYKQTIVDPTETRQGYTINECVNCGKVFYSDYVNPTGHEYTVTTTEATCEQDGFVTHTCACGETYSESIPTTGHDYKLESYVLPTCTTTGTKTYQCIKCDSSYAETIGVLEHDYTFKTELIESTCTEQGYSINYCMCGAFTKSDYVAVLGHSYHVIESVEPSCTSKGLITSECKVCGDVTTETIPALGDGHTYKLIESAELTCVTSKYELYECSVCGIQKYDNIEVFTGHTYDTCNTTNPTCTQEGKRIYTCTSCHENITETIPATGHTMGTWENLDGETESETVRRCTICGETLSSTKNNHQVKWNVNGDIYIDYLETGYIIARPATPNYGKYKFSHWSPDVPISMGSEDLSFEAIYYSETNGNYLSKEFEYTVNNGVATITGYVGCKSIISIPSELGGHSVTAIGSKAFFNNEAIENVYIDEHITIIGNDAFKNCINLNSIVFYSTDCTIYSSAETIDSDVILLGYPNSTAQKYAEKHNRKFVSTVDNPCTITVVTEDTEKGVVSKTTHSIVGNTIKINAEPTFKYNFYCWKDSMGNIVSKNAEYTFVAKGDTTLTAYFTKRRRKIATNVENGGLSVPETAEIESTVILKPIENEGYVFIENSITVNGVPIVGDTFIMPDEDVVLNAKFIRNDYYFALKDAINNAKQIDATMYSAESISLLNAIVTVAESNLINNISQEESNTRITEIETAINNLVPLNGACGSNLTWSYDESTKTLTISGTGAMFDYSMSNCPWKTFEKSLTTVYFSRGITAIGNNAFNNYESLTDVYYEYTEENWSTVSIGESNTSLISATLHCHTHDFVSSVTTKPTCTQEGILTYTCTCTDTYTETIPANGHTAGEWKISISPTCTEVGEQTKKCTICNTLLETAVVPANGHTESEWQITKPSTCYQKGTQIKICTVCKEVLQTTDVQYANHTEGEWNVTSKPTCTKTGTQTKRCTVCYTLLESQEIPKTEHVEGDWEVATQPTCILTGERVKKCITCKSVITIEPIPATGHTISDWEIIEKPTETSVGQSVRKCTICGNVIESKEIPMLTDTSGFCGNDLLWNYDLETKTLTITGTGAMFDYTATTRPWEVFEDEITTVVLGDDVTSIGRLAFYHFALLTDVDMGGVTTIGINAFNMCKALKQVEISKNVIVINSGAFNNCTALTDVYYEGTEDEWNTLSIGTNNTYLTSATLHCQYKNQVIFVEKDMHVEGLIYEFNSLVDFKDRVNLDGVYLKAYDAKGVELTDNDLLGTGATVYIYDIATNNLIGIYTVVLYGDVNGDGLINDADKEIITSVATCTGTIENKWCLMAADTNHDGAIDGFDVIETELQVLDMHNIEQVNNSAYIPKKEEEKESQSVA